MYCCNMIWDLCGDAQVRMFSLINALIFCELAGENSEPEALRYSLLDVAALDRETLKAVHDLYVKLWDEGVKGDGKKYRQI